MSYLANKICLICCRSSLQFVILNAPMNLKNNQDHIGILTYLDCLRFCSKLEFADDDGSEMQTLCYACADNLERTYTFLEQVLEAHRRMSSIKNAAKNDQDKNDCTKYDAAKEEETLNCSNKETDKMPAIDGTAKLELEQVFLDDSSTNFVTDLEDDLFDHANNENYLNTAAETSVEQMVFICKICKKRYRNVTALNNHCRRKHNAKMIYCKLCCSFIANEKTTRNHLKMMHSDIVRCDECDHQCAEHSLNRHKLNEHGSSKFACAQCSIKYSCQYDLDCHLRYHRRREKQAKLNACNICQKLFALPSKLRAHLKTHATVRETFACQLCDKKYILKRSLENHMRKHDGKMLQCKQCEKSFMNFCHLKQHMRSHSGDCPEMCDICGKKYATKSILRKHQWRHQGLKLKCNQCDKLFTSLKALREHSYSHSGMPFTCRHCVKSFPSKPKLKLHFKKVHDSILNAEELEKSSNKIAPLPFFHAKEHLVPVTNEVAKTKNKKRKVGARKTLSTKLQTKKVDKMKTVTNETDKIKTLKQNTMGTSE